MLFGMLYRMDAVEQVGSGVRRIREICRDYGVEEPDYDVREHWVTLTFKRPKLVDGVRVKEATPEVTPEVTPQVTPQVLALLREAGNVASSGELQQAACLKDRVHFLKTYLEPLLQVEWIERTVPDKPRSSKQKYRLTEKGRAVLSREGA